LKPLALKQLVEASLKPKTTKEAEGVKHRLEVLASLRSSA